MPPSVPKLLTIYGGRGGGSAGSRRCSLVTADRQCGTDDFDQTEQLTAHTANPSPLSMFQRRGLYVHNSILADIAPTALGC